MAVGRAELLTKEEEVEIFILALLASKPSAPRRPTLLPAANSISLRLEDLYTPSIMRRQGANVNAATEQMPACLCKLLWLGQNPERYSSTGPHWVTFPLQIHRR